jgi:hypothetical protein
MHPRQPAAEFPLLSCCTLTAAAKAPCSPSPPPLLPLSLHCCGRHCVLRPTEQLSVDATAAPALNPLHPTAHCLPAPLSTRSRILSAQQPHRAGVTDRSPGKGPLFSAPASAAANVAAAVTAAALLRPPLQPDPAAHPPTPSWPPTDPPPAPIIRNAASAYPLRLVFSLLLLLPRRGSTLRAPRLPRQCRARAGTSSPATRAAHGHFCHQRLCYC